MSKPARVARPSADASTALVWPAVMTGSRRPRLHYRLLGPVELLRDGEPCTPAALKIRALLAVLLLHANESMSAERLIDELWQVDPPRSAAATLQLYVSDLRRVLDHAHADTGRPPGRHPVLPSRPAGYELSVQPGELDLHRFRELAAEGRDRVAAGLCAEAGAAFTEALALWRGPALSDLGRADLARSYTARLDEERLALLHDRFGTEICRGRGPAAVPELQELCVRHPLREQFHEQLMLALCAAGRRAEALDAYAKARRTLIDEVGIEPGPALRAVQQAILAGRAPCDAAHRSCRRCAG